MEPFCEKSRCTGIRWSVDWKGLLKHITDPLAGFFDQLVNNYFGAVDFVAFEKGAK